MKGVLNIQADAEHIPLKDDAVDLVFTSPPYGPQRTYGINAQRGVVAWVDWMLLVVAEMTRVSRGLALVNCAGWTRKWCYQPGPEMLLSEWFKRGGRCWRPCYWHRVGIPGSGGKQWFRADIEYVLCFTKCKAAIPWADNVANGHAPKWAPGGEMSNRLNDGRRVNQWGHSFDTGATITDGDFVRSRGVRPSHVTAFGNRPSHANNRANGTHQKKTYFNGNQGMRLVELNNLLERGNEKDATQVVPAKANPGVLVKVNVGGGLMGHPYAHENEAPFPVDLAAWFIRSHCPPGGIVLDCHGGSGTTADAALREGRRAITADLRFKMAALTARRLATPYAKKAKRPRAAKPEPSLFPEVA